MTGGVVGLGLFMLVYLLSRGHLGMGDVKLAGLIGLMLGYPAVINALVVGILLGARRGAIYLATRRATNKSTMAYAPTFRWERCSPCGGIGEVRRIAVTLTPTLRPVSAAKRFLHLSLSLTDVLFLLVMMVLVYGHLQELLTAKSCRCCLCCSRSLLSFLRCASTATKRACALAGYPAGLGRDAAAAGDATK